MPKQLFLKSMFRLKSDLRFTQKQTANENTLAVFYLQGEYE